MALYLLILILYHTFIFFSFNSHNNHKHFISFSLSSSLTDASCIKLSFALCNTSGINNGILGLPKARIWYILALFPELLQVAVVDNWVLQFLLLHFICTVVASGYQSQVEASYCNRHLRAHDKRYSLLKISTIQARLWMGEGVACKEVRIHNRVSSFKEMRELKYVILQRVGKLKEQKSIPTISATLHNLSGPLQKHMSEFCSELLAPFCFNFLSWKCCPQEGQSSRVVDFARPIAQFPLQLNRFG